MSQREMNGNTLERKETADDIEKKRARTINLMFQGAREEQKRFDEIQKMKKTLKGHLEVIEFFF